MLLCTAVSRSARHVLALAAGRALSHRLLLLLAHILYEVVRVLLKYLVARERVQRELGKVDALLLVEVRSDTFAHARPFTLLLDVLRLECLAALLHQLVLLAHHAEVFAELRTLLLMLTNVLLQLKDALLQVADLGLERLLFILEVAFDLENLHVDHFIFLNLGDELFLSQSEVLIDLLQLILQRLQLLRVVTREEARTKVAAGLRALLARRRLLLALTLEFLQMRDSLRQPLVVQLQLLDALLPLLKLISSRHQLFLLLLHRGRLLFQMMSQRFVFLLELAVLRFQVFHMALLD